MAYYFKKTSSRAFIFIKTNDRNTVYIIVNEHIAMIFSFNKSKQWKHVSVQISKNI